MIDIKTENKHKKLHAIAKFLEQSGHIGDAEFLLEVSCDLHDAAVVCHHIKKTRSSVIIAGCTTTVGNTAIGLKPFIDESRLQQSDDSLEPVINTEPRHLTGKTHDWQVTTILSNDLFIETDCNSGRKRRIRKSQCSCGNPVLIEYGVKGFRKDKKRVFYPDRDCEGYDVFRCEVCREPVSQSVPYARYD